MSISTCEQLCAFLDSSGGDASIEGVTFTNCCSNTLLFREGTSYSLTGVSGETILDVSGTTSNSLFIFADNSGTSILSNMIFQSNVNISALNSSLFFQNCVFESDVLFTIIPPPSSVSTITFYGCTIQGDFLMDTSQEIFDSSQQSMFYGFEFKFTSISSFTIQSNTIIPIISSTDTTFGPISLSFDINFSYSDSPWFLTINAIDNTFGGFTCTNSGKYCPLLDYNYYPDPSTYIDSSGKSFICNLTGELPSFSSPVSITIGSKNSNVSLDTLEFISNLTYIDSSVNSFANISVPGGTIQSLLNVSLNGQLGVFIGGNEIDVATTLETCVCQFNVQTQGSTSGLTIENWDFSLIPVINVKVNSSQNTSISIGNTIGNEIVFNMSESNNISYIMLSVSSPAFTGNLVSYLATNCTLCAFQTSAGVLSAISIVDTSGNNNVYTCAGTGSFSYNGQYCFNNVLEFNRQISSDTYSISSTNPLSFQSGSESGAYECTFSGNVVLNLPFSDADPGFSFQNCTFNDTSYSIFSNSPIYFCDCSFNTTIPDASNVVIGCYTVSGTTASATNTTSTSSNMTFRLNSTEPATCSVPVMIYSISLEYKPLLKNTDPSKLEFLIKQQLEDHCVVYEKRYPYTDYFLSCRSLFGFLFGKICDSELPFDTLLFLNPAEQSTKMLHIDVQNTAFIELFTTDCYEVTSTETSVIIQTTVSNNKSYAPFTLTIDQSTGMLSSQGYWFTEKCLELCYDENFLLLGEWTLNRPLLTFLEEYTAAESLSKSLCILYRATLLDNSLS